MNYTRKKSFSDDWRRITKIIIYIVGHATIITTTTLATAEKKTSMHYFICVFKIDAMSNPYKDTKESKSPSKSIMAGCQTDSIAMRKKTANLERLQSSQIKPD